MLNKIYNWFDYRFPISSLIKSNLINYYVPKNLNFLYYFGSLLLAVFAIQIISGIWLTMFYNPSSLEAFDSVEYIMRDIKFGWLIRYIHSTGASFFFICMYLHIFKAILYGSYKKPGELLWIIGVILFLCLLIECFFGYLLPWGNMSYWGAQVITSLFGALPLIGEYLMEWIRGDYSVSGVTLNRFFALHVSAMPILFIILILLHLIALHEIGSNNPTGLLIKKSNMISFHPYYTIKDLFGFSFFLLLFFFVVFFIPEFFGLFLEHDNFIQANSLSTPEHIAPVWYMTPFYAILRSIPDKLIGVILMFMSIFLLFLLPWLDRSKNKSMIYKNLFFKIFFVLFLLSFVILGYIGITPNTSEKVLISQICTSIYFMYFIFMPIYSRYGK